MVTKLEVVNNKIRRYMFFNYFHKKEKTQFKMLGRIVNVDGDNISIRLLDTSKLKKRQFVRVGIPEKRKTASGEMISIENIIACGEIKDVNPEMTVIHSPRNSPIISNITIRKNLNQQRYMMITIIS